MEIVEQCAAIELSTRSNLPKLDTMRLLSGGPRESSLMLLLFVFYFVGE